MGDEGGKAPGSQKLLGNPARSICKMSMHYCFKTGGLWYLFHSASALERVALRRQEAGDRRPAVATVSRYVQNQQAKCN